MMNKNKRLILVCHYFPPETNVGVRRVLFWANYLCERGFSVTVLTTKKKGSSSIFDVVNPKVKVVEYSFFTLKEVKREKFDDDVIATKRDMPNWKKHLFKLAVTVKRKLVNKYIGQLMDIRLLHVLGIMFSIKIGMHKKYIESLNVYGSTIISTAPPWPMHVLAAFLSKKYKMKFFADYRDPFSNNHVFSNKFSKLEEKLERWILKNATGVFSVSSAWVSYYETFHDNVKLLRNGYDESMFNDEVVSPTLSLDKQKKINLNYFGSVEHEERIPKILIEYVNDTELDIVLTFYGSCSLLKEFLDRNCLHKNIKLAGCIPYNSAIEKMINSDINVVCESMLGNTPSHIGLIPTKIYEYMAAKRPILAIVSGRSEVYPLLRKSGLLINEPVEDKRDIDISLRRAIDMSFFPDHEFIKSLSRQLVSDKLIEIIK